MRNRAANWPFVYTNFAILFAYVLRIYILSLSLSLVVCSPFLGRGTIGSKLIPGTNETWGLIHILTN